ncbi:hypothetical protein EV356DRAFT_50045 [Viridothelium virens]|uniref:Uncharacterized protein n=1 Tax=Viridothelium virens TaxID=1048519 RepID=A0A6A6HGS4_VIRVR|nr:hypothetical protein EV356DRAFT_50045 [Viridothelium virens]
MAETLQSESLRSWKGGGARTETEQAPVGVAKQERQELGAAKASKLDSYSMLEETKAPCTYNQPKRNEFAIGFRYLHDGKFQTISDVTAYAVTCSTVLSMVTRAKTQKLYVFESQTHLSSAILVNNQESSQAQRRRGG